MRSRRTHWFVLVWSLTSWLAGVGLVTAGCSVTPEQISTWKGTQKGPDKLRAVVKDKSATPQLRALATAALIEIGMGLEAAQDRATVDANVRGQIAHELIAPLSTLLGTSVTQAGPVTPVQISAKDALFLSRTDADPADRARIDELLIKWTTAELATRAPLGGQSTEKILSAIGPSAAASLVPLAKPGPDLLLAAQLLGSLGDRDAQKRAAIPLIANIRAATRGPQESVLMAVGLIGGADATALLVEISTSNNMPPPTRAKALYALAQGHLSAGDDKALTACVSIIRDTHAPGEVREAGFQVAEKLGPAAVTSLVGLFTDKDSVVRFRAVEAALHAGGDKAIAVVLAALPDDRPMKSEDLDSFVVHDLGLIGDSALPALLIAAKGEGVRPLGQLAAIRTLGRKGKADALAILAGLSSKTESVHNLVPPSSLAAEAKSASDAIGKRR